MHSAYFLGTYILVDKSVRLRHLFNLHTKLFFHVRLFGTQEYIRMYRRTLGTVSIAIKSVSYHCHPGSTFFSSNEPN